MSSADEDDVCLVFSAHGVPLRVIEAGDPYQKHIEETVRLVMERGAWPNPVSVTGTLTFALPRAASVELRLYDVAGALRRTLAIGEFAAGEHAIALETRGLRPGTYFASLVVGGRRLTRTVVLAP